MKLTQLVVIAFAVAGGWCGAIFFRQSVVNNAAGARKILLYQSPMHPWVTSDKPGKCTVCGMDLAPIYESGTNFDRDASDVVMLRAGSVNAVGVRTAEVKKQPLVRMLRVAGMIGEDESRHGVISAPVDGRIDGLAMSCDGDKVTRRQPLATIFSRPLLAAANDYKAALDQGGSALEQAKRRLEQYGLVWEQINAIPTRQPDDLYFGILAPLTGTIVRSYVSEGQFVKEGEKLFEIADFNKMWFVFTAPEKDLPLIQVGQIVTLNAPSLAGQMLKARVSSISPNLDEQTRAARVRVVLENPERRIKNNTFAEGTVEIEAPEVLAIPRSAVLWPDRAPRVYVETVKGSYQQRRLKLGRAGDACWEVIEGLQEGERVVVAGNMLIDGQAQLDKELVATPDP